MRQYMGLFVGVKALVFMALVFVAFSIFAADSDIVISEIMVNTITTETSNAGEWVEVYNRGAGAVDLAGWQLEDNNGAAGRDTITTGMCPGGSCSIPAGGCWLIAITQTDLQAEFNQYTNPNQPSVDVNKTIFLGSGQKIGNGLANTDDHLILLNSSGTAVDCSSWENSTTCKDLTYVAGGNGVDHNFDGSDGQSIANIGGSWYDHEPNGSPYNCTNVASGGSPTAIALSTLNAHSSAVMFPLRLRMAALLIAGAAGLTIRKRRRPH